MKKIITSIILIALSLLTYSQVTDSDTIVALGKLNPASDNMRVWAAKINVDIKRSIDNVDSITVNSAFRLDPSSTIIAGTNLSWTGSTLNATGTLSATWGTITGTLSSQTDLQNALDAKQNTITDSDDISEGSTNLFLTTTERSNISTNNSKISYTDASAVSLNTAKISYTDATDVGNNTTHRTSNGSDHTYLDQSVISGSTPTFTNTNFTESTNKNYVTDAEQSAIGTISGKQDNITLTTTGSSGASTLIGATLNIPIYTGGGGGDVSFTDTVSTIATKYDVDTLQESIDDLQSQLNDTAVFYLQAVFGLGSGQTIDTASFAADAFCGSFRNWTGDTIVIDSINAVLLGTTPDIDIQFFISTSITDGSADELRTTDFNITSITTGDTFSSFNGTTDVLPGQRIWCKVTAVATKPTYLEITVAYKPK